MLPKKLKHLKWDKSYLKYLVLDIYFSFLMVFALVLLIVSNNVSDRTYESIDDLIQISAIKVSVALTLISFVIIVIGVIGCCATYTKNKFILILFCILLLILVFIEIFSAYNSFYYNSKLNDNKIDNRFKDLTLKYKWLNESSVNKSDSIVDQIQRSYNCCGTHSYDSWDQLRPSYVDQNSYPFSCCAQILNNTSNICDKGFVNQTNSCFNSLNQRLSELRRSMSVMAGFTIANSVFKVLGIPLVWYFGKQLQENFIV